VTFLADDSQEPFSYCGAASCVILFSDAAEVFEDSLLFFPASSLMVPSGELHETVHPSIT
jgi:hypothetical protein